MTGPRTPTCGYSAMHLRLRTRYGPARDGQCEADGCDRPADEWALRAATPADRIRVEDRPCGWPSEPSGRRAVRYSTSIDDYARLCRHHHRQQDHRHRVLVVRQLVARREETAA